MTDEMVFIPSSSMGQSNAVPLASKSDRADLIDKIKPEQVVELIRQRLMGKEFKDNQWVDVKALQNRKLTEAGAWEVSNYVLGVASIATSISKLKDHEIKLRLRNLTKAVQRSLVANWHESDFNIKNTSMLHYVHQIVFSVCLVVLKQADEASIQELLKATVTENRNVNTERKEGTLSRVKRALGM